MYTIKKENNNQFNALITIEKEQWEEFVKEAYEKNKDKFAVQGFRKGKVPRKVIEQNYGATIFYDDAMEMAFAKNYEEILRNEKEIRPVASPEVSIKKFDADGIELSIIIQSEPEVILGEYKELNVEMVRGEVKKEDIDSEINQSRERLAKYEVVNRSAKIGDFVTIDFVGSVDGKEFEGGKAEDYRLELGSKSFVDTFEEQIVGMNNGEKKTIKVTFPDNYKPELKGKKADFEVTLNKVEEKILPEINDEFASNVSEFETLEEYKKDIEKHLGESLKANLERQNENKIIEVIVESSTVEIPKCMIEEQLESIIKDFENRLAYQGMKLEDYFNYTGLTLEKFKEEKQDFAKNTVKTRLVLEKIILQEKLNVKEEELDAKIKEIASKYKKTTQDYKKNLTERELIYFENAILMEKLVKFLKENNKLV